MVQQAKARSFLDQLREAEVQLRCQADPVYQERERDLLERIAALEGDEQQTANLALLENELSLLEADLRQADPRYAELKYPRSCTLAEAQQQVLRPGEMLLEFHLGKQASYLWSVGRDHFGFHQLPAAGDIERQVQGLLPMLRDYNLLGDDAAYFIAQAAPLSEMLLGPVADQLASARRVIVAADGILDTLPFAVLLTGPADRPGFCRPALPGSGRGIDQRPFPERVAAVAGGRRSGIPPPSGDLLIVGRPRPDHVRDAGVFARAAGVVDLPEVPFAAEEIAGITASFDPARPSPCSRGRGHGGPVAGGGPDTPPFPPLHHPRAVQRETPPLFGAGPGAGTGFGQLSGRERDLRPGSADAGRSCFRPAPAGWAGRSAARDWWA